MFPNIYLNMIFQSIIP